MPGRIRVSLADKETESEMNSEREAERIREEEAPVEESPRSGSGATTERFWLSVSLTPRAPKGEARGTRPPGRVTSSYEAGRRPRRTGLAAWSLVALPPHSLPCAISRACFKTVCAQARGQSGACGSRTRSSMGLAGPFRKRSVGQSSPTLRRVATNTKTHCHTRTCV